MPPLTDGEIGRKPPAPGTRLGALGRRERRARAGHAHIDVPFAFYAGLVAFLSACLYARRGRREGNREQGWVPVETERYRRTVARESDGWRYAADNRTPGMSRHDWGAPLLIYDPLRRVY